VTRRDVCLLGEQAQVEGLVVAAVDEVPGAKQVSLEGRCHGGNSP
jgi:hypothetical protein